MSTSDQGADGYRDPMKERNPNYPYGPDVTCSRSVLFLQLVWRVHFRKERTPLSKATKGLNCCRTNDPFFTSLLIPGNNVKAATLRTTLILNFATTRTETSDRHVELALACMSDDETKKGFGRPSALEAVRALQGVLKLYLYELDNDEHHTPSGEIDGADKKRHCSLCFEYRGVGVSCQLQHFVCSDCLETNNAGLTTGSSRCLFSRWLQCSLRYFRPVTGAA